MPVTNRKLTSIENMGYLMDKSAAFNIMINLCVKGRFTVEILSMALEILRKKHEYLSYFIRETDEGPEFVYDEKGKIPVRLVENAPADRWIFESNLELNSFIDTSNAPMANAVLIKKDGGADILIRISHIICDGISIVNFAHDLLEIISCLDENKKIDLPDYSSDVYPDIKYFPEINAKPVPDKNTVGQITDIEMIDNVIYYPVEKRSTNIYPCYLSPTQTSYIIDKCKETKTTVNSLIAAAMTLKMKNYITDKYGIRDGLSIKARSALNLRDYYNCDVKTGQFGCWAGYGYVNFRMEEISSLWDCAAAFNRRLKTYINNGEPFIYLKKSMEAYSAYPLSDLIKKNESRAPQVMLTNVGRLDIPEQYGNNFKLERICVIGTNHRHWVNDLNFGVCAATFNGRLNLNFLYLNPVRTFNEAGEFVNSILKLIFEDKPELLEDCEN